MGVRVLPRQPARSGSGGQSAGTTHGEVDGSSPSPSTTMSIAPSWGSGKLASLSKRRPRVRVPSEAPQPVRLSARPGGLHPPGAGAAPARATIASSSSSKDVGFSPRRHGCESRRGDHPSSGRGAEVARVPWEHEVGGSKPPVLTIAIIVWPSCGSAAVSKTAMPEVRLLPAAPPHVNSDAWPSGKAPVSKTSEAR